MEVFNQESRGKNAIKASTVGALSNVVKILIGFAYRTIFLYVLSADYLGLNGLFTNILQVLSLAELGVTTAITFRFYKPINDNDVQKVGELMNFFKWVYRIIALVILVAGLIILPFVKGLVNNPDEIPGDVNIYVIFVLFLINTLSTYVFSYKLTLLNADQKADKFSLINTAIYFAMNAVQIIVLLISRNYTATLIAGIIATLLTNFIFSEIVKRRYMPVFKVKEMLPKEERKVIFKDTRATMYHKIGTVVVTSTDSIVLSKFVSLIATGIYSNYSLIIVNVQNVISQFLGNFVSSLGNARLNQDKDTYYELYKKMNFMGLWVAACISVCLYFLIDDFIYMWLGGDYLFSKLTTIMLCLQFFLSVSRAINGSFTNATGLFVKDRIRPLIEAAVNLGVSIWLVLEIGIAGVFIGTVVSTIVTVSWREPLILYRYEFKGKKISDYWKTYFSFLAITALSCVVFDVLKTYVLGYTMTWPALIIEAIVSFALINLILALIFKKRDEFEFFKSVIKKVTGKLKKKG